MSGRSWLKRIEGSSNNDKPMTMMMGGTSCRHQPMKREAGTGAPFKKTKQKNNKHTRFSNFLVS